MRIEQKRNGNHPIFLIKHFQFSAQWRILLENSILMGDTLKTDIIHVIPMYKLCTCAIKIPLCVSIFHLKLSQTWNFCYQSAVVHPKLNAFMHFVREQQIRLADVQPYAMLCLTALCWWQWWAAGDTRFIYFYTCASITFWAEEKKKSNGAQRQSTFCSPRQWMHSVSTVRIRMTEWELIKHTSCFLRSWDGTQQMEIANSLNDLWVFPGKGNGSGRSARYTPLKYSTSFMPQYICLWNNANPMKDLEMGRISTRE